MPRDLITEAFVQAWAKFAVHCGSVKLTADSAVWETDSQGDFGLKALTSSDLAEKLPAVPASGHLVAMAITGVLHKDIEEEEWRHTYERATEGYTC